MPTRQGSIHLFRFSGIDLYLHWSWFVVALFEIRGGMGTYSSVAWNLLEYLALFLIVTLHEFGHALACRQVGGRANQIVLWPLGGVAYVDPPPRPGATLWSIAAGPLVNVALIPVLLILVTTSRSLGWAKAVPDADSLLGMVWWINSRLLIFNMLPIYPLDGGQILRSLLWFVLGRARSLMVAVILGFLSVAFIGFALWIHPTWLGGLSPTWLGILALFMLMNCWGGLQHARALLRFAKLPRRNGFACPECKTAPPVGELWKCGQCEQTFDTFQTGAVCPRCGMQYPVTKCMDCGRAHPMSEWAEAALMAPRL
ncbi:Peptidase M50 [Candidatus Sulfotelmatobacter kueseliae]|uniref:Peptidase M50 n=1 Tax=Candidatus Sulfotelmatobacter kueseliae TaxID=2042962 RepID=A0A2U3KE83_9BACT|nr:Peptidase M50 [Candidatus Sulfotelmatobacter kueseliae]